MLPGDRGRNAGIRGFRRFRRGVGPLFDPSSRAYAIVASISAVTVKRSGSPRAKRSTSSTVTSP